MVSFSGTRIPSNNEQLWIVVNSSFSRRCFGKNGILVIESICVLCGSSLVVPVREQAMMEVRHLDAIHPEMTRVIGNPL
jgi:hypothetical protein